MIVEVFKCDRCGVVHSYNHDLNELMVHYGWISLKYRDGHDIKEIELCSECAKDVLTVALNVNDYELKVVEGE